MTIVRLATRADEPALMQICRELHKENGLFEMHDDMVREMLDRAFDRKGGIVGVIDGEKMIEAVLFMIISTFWYSRDNHLEELFSYVRPAARKSNHAASLIGFAKECSDKIGIPLVIGVLTNTRMETKVRLYRRKLGMPAGAFFVYGGNYVNDTRNDEIWRTHSRGRNKANGASPHAMMTTAPLPMLPLAPMN